jgi:hypothetical protein
MPDHGLLSQSIPVYPQTARSYITFEFLMAELRNEKLLFFSRSNSDFV